MIRVVSKEEIDCPIDEVFEKLIDIDGYPEWMPNNGLFVNCYISTEGPIGVGTGYIDKTRLGTVQGEISAFDRPHRVVFHYTDHMFGKKMMDGWPGYTLESDGVSSTRVHHVAEARLYGFYRLFEPLLRIIARRERQRTVDALKASLKSSH